MLNGGRAAKGHDFSRAETEPLTRPSATLSPGERAGVRGMWAGGTDKSVPFRDPAGWRQRRQAKPGKAAIRQLTGCGFSSLELNRRGRQAEFRVKAIAERATRMSLPVLRVRAWYAVRPGPVKSNRPVTLLASN
jgi:hypothetical protein